MTISDSHEQEHLNLIISSFKNYHRITTESFCEKLQKVPKDCTMVKERIEKNIELCRVNQLLFDRILECSVLVQPNDIQEKKRDTLNHSKMISTLKQFYRDWTVEGKRERDRSYKPILDTLEQLFPQHSRHSIKVLVPGAGLGRLVFEICKRGFSCQGNEVSYHMLLASEYILNHARQGTMIYPWIHQYSNMPSQAIQQKGFLIPDVVVGNLPPNVDFSMVGGDFKQVYGTPEHQNGWDVIVTCFFIDTATNLQDYISIIDHILPPNGLWIHIGPLLYHHPESLEFTAEEFVALVGQKFRIRKEYSVDGVYAACPESMMHYVYHSLFFVAEKM